MNIQEINDLYQTLGLGSEVEREQFLKWRVSEGTAQKTHIFIEETAYSKQIVVQG